MAETPVLCSARQQYGALGVEGFYTAHGEDYRNKHFAGLCSTIASTLDATWPAGEEAEMAAAATSSGSGRAGGASSGSDGALRCNVLRLAAAGGGGSAAAGPGNRPFRVLDLACGSGEASLALFAWLKGRCSTAVAKGQPPPFTELHLTAADPYTAAAFRARTGLPHVSPLSFEDVQEGALEGSSFDLVVVSFALHLLDPSRLYATLSALARAARWLVIASPHKRPAVTEASGWRLVADRVGEQRVHVRLFESTLGLAAAEGGE